MVSDSIRANESEHANTYLGNYIISGGTETVLVLWQLDTGKQQFLPHMSATIQNVVVSPTGTSYGIQLADNSAMILSTAELEPTANIAGIQASVLESEEPLESQVEKVEDLSWQPPLVQSTPAVINPADPSRLLLGVGRTQEVSATKPLVISNPFLQTFDLGSGHNLSRQALTRTNITNVNAAPSAHRISEPRVTHVKISHDGKWLATVDEWTPPAREMDFLGHQGKDLSLEQQHRREVFLKFWQWSKETEMWELVSRIDSPHSLSRDAGDAGRIFSLAADPGSSRFSTIGEDGMVRTWATKTRKRDGVVVRSKDGSAFRNWHCQHAICLSKAELPDGTGDSENYPTSGSVAFSEDGSILAAACNGDEGLLHLLDLDSGVIRVSHTGLFEGTIVNMEFLGQDLIVLSNKLFVFDIVSEEFRFAIKLASSPVSLSSKQKQEMMHLAVDHRSRTFAVSLPTFSPDLGQPSLLAARCELTVFHQDSREPQLKEDFPTIITALLPAVSSEGYIVLDTSAEIYTVMKKGSQAVTSLAQSTSALELDTTPEEPAGGLLRLVEEDVEEVEDYLPPTPEATQDGEDGDEDENPVVTKQQLSEIFDIGPSFALPPMEEIFYQVAGLFSGKPLAQGVS
jgi:NET1-associated nuclear protein 1 (U3 small nucleolar RNA-associated protein 17)